jgi:3-oxoadipate enol-lactonase
MKTLARRVRSRAWVACVTATVVGCLGGELSSQTISGVAEHGLYWETRGEGEPLVFVHAFSLDGRMWEPQITAFAEDFQVVRYDLRGHGRSAAPEGPYTGFDDLRALLDALGIESATLVGLSAGSEIAVNFAIEYPDRVAGLVLAAPGLSGYRTPPLPWAQSVFEAVGAGDGQRAAELWAETPIMALHANREAADLVTSLVVENWRIWTYRRTEQPLAPPAIERLNEIACPVLLVVGDADLPHIWDVARVIAHGVPDATTVGIAGAGHIVNLDAPGAFNEALEAFLKRR